MKQMWALDHAKLDHAKLDHAKLDHEKLDHAKLDHAKLEHAKLYHAKPCIKKMDCSFSWRITDWLTKIQNNLENRCTE